MPNQDPWTRPGRILIAACLALGVAPEAASATTPPERPRLVVVIIVDQLRADFLTRFEPHFVEGGFRRLMRGGVFYPNAYFSYGSSATAPGHATVATGRLPRDHGIVANKWFIEPGKTLGQSAVHDPDVRLVGVDKQHAAGAPSPRHLIGPTLGDQLKLTDRRSRVFSIALKDRSAVFMGGRRPDGAFWYDRHAGRLVTSTYYADRLPPYVRAFNSAGWCDRFAGQTWSKLLPDNAYAGCRPPDPAWLTGDGGIGKSFPHALPDQPGRALNSALLATPFGNDIVLEIARRILTNEKLGSDDSPDLLWIGLSANDYCGHLFGPESPEVLDITVRTDRQIGAFLDVLDETVGLDQCIIALTADHGVTTAPQQARAMGLGGDLIDLEALRADLNRRLRETLGSLGDDRDYILGINLPWVYLDRELARGGAPARAVVLRAAQKLMRDTEGIAEVVTAHELVGPEPPASQPTRRLAWRCHRTGRAGELYVRLEPYWYKAKGNFAGHTVGTAHDRHVPILIAGPGVEPRRVLTEADPVDIPVTLAALLGIEPPLGATGRVLSGVEIRAGSVHD